MGSMDLTSANVRGRLNNALRTDADFDAFCLDHFPNIYRQFSTGMERQKKLNLLLSLTQDLQEIVNALELLAKPPYDPLSSRPNRLLAPEQHRDPLWDRPVMRSLSTALMNRNGIQILGERHMGATRLLQWAGEQAKQQNLKPVFLDGSTVHQLTHASLAKAIASQRQDQVILDRIRESVTEGRQLEIAIDYLLELSGVALLIDRAHHMFSSKNRHREANDLLNRLGSRCNSGHIWWVSTSRADLHPLISGMGLTSPFLSGQPVVCVGALETEIAHEAIKRALSECRLSADTAMLFDELGGCAGVLSWFQGWLPTLSHEAPRLLQLLDLRARGFLGEHFFADWWMRRTAEERSLLRQCAETGIEIASELPKTSPDILERLVERGLLRKHHGHYTCDGRLWAQYVLAATP